MSSANKSRLFTTNFLLVCSTSTLAGLSFFLLLPTVPLYVGRRFDGQQVDVGVVVGAFTAAAVLSYPLVGRELDRRGRKPVLMLGLAIFALAGVLYGFATALPSLVLLRLVQGAAWAAIVAALNTLLADAVPANRRGEAMGYYGISIYLAMALAPPLAVAVVQAYDFGAVFLASAAFAVVGFALVAGVSDKYRRTSAKSTASSTPPGRLSLGGALFPPSIMFCVNVSYGALISFLPLYALSAGLDNPGLFFTVYALVIIPTRLLAGGLSDRFGRRGIVVPGLSLLIAGLILLSVSTDAAGIVIVGILYGFGFGTVHPTLMAMTIDAVDVERRGAAMGYFSAAFDLGIAVGAMAMGLVAQFAGFRGMYLTTALVIFAGLIAFILGKWTTRPVPTNR